MIEGKKFFTLSFALCLLFVGYQAQAQVPVELYIEISESKFAPNSEIVATVFVSSNQPVNTFDIALKYPKELLKPLAFNDSGSIVDLWQIKQWNSNDGFIKLAGGMLGPFSGNKGRIGEIRFRALQESTGEISFDTAKIYFADGKGTVALVNAKSSFIEVKDDASLFYQPQKDDVVAPVFEFLVKFEDPVDATSLVAFQVKDSGSGLKAVYIRSSKWLSFDSWKTAISPAKIQSEAWRYQIAAVDNEGNFTIITRYITSNIVKKIFSIVLISFLAVIILYVIIRKWFLRKSLFSH